MSEFSECLSYFIKEGKTDTALLEERTGVPCSVIASFLKGKELPEQSVFRILLRELPLTVEEERILSHCYYVSSVGEWTYRRRSYMQQQLSAINPVLTILLGTRLGLIAIRLSPPISTRFRKWGSSFTAARLPWRAFCTRF